MVRRPALAAAQLALGTMARSSALSTHGQTVCVSHEGARGRCGGGVRNRQHPALRNRFCPPHPPPGPRETDLVFARAGVKERDRGRGARLGRQAKPPSGEGKRAAHTCYSCDSTCPVILSDPPPARPWGRWPTTGDHAAQVPRATAGTARKGTNPSEGRGKQAGRESWLSSRSGS